MSFPPTVLDGVQINGLQKAEPGETYSSGGPYLITESDITNSQGLFAADSKSRTPSRIRGFENATTLRNKVKGVLGDTDQAVILRDNSLLTYGLKGSKALEVGGVVVDATRSKKVIVTLGSDRVKNTGSATVNSRFIPDDVRSSVKTGKVNTLTELGKGSDSYTGSSGKDLVSLGGGNNGAVMGKGKDLVVANQRIKRSTAELGKGNDRVLLSDRTLSRKGSFTITDFNAKRDTLLLETRSSKVSGIGSNTLKISTGNGTFKVVSEADRFTGGSVDFVI